MSTNIKQICEKLKSEPLLHLSLHSKELFHSNVLAWFLEENPSQARELLGQWVPSRDTTNHGVRREEFNLDLIIEIPGLAPVVIENKMFAPPDEAQLEEYSSVILENQDLKDASLILLSLGTPNWPNSTFTSSSGLVWRHISYQQLALAMAKQVDATEGFRGALLRHYVSFISLLHELAAEIANLGPSEPIEVDASTRELLRTIRLHDAVGKLRARSAAASAQRAWSSTPGNVSATFKAAFTKGMPLLDAFIDCKNGDRIGWQYQNQQWRLAVITKSHYGKTDDLKDRRHAVVAQRYAEWFDFSSIESLIGRTETQVPNLEVKGRYYGYNPDFVYRYRSLPNLTLEELETLSKHYLTEAKKWI